MAKIVVSLSESGDRETVCDALGRKGHAIVQMPPAAEDAKATAARLLEIAPVAAVMEYRREDAASVKILQAVTERDHPPRLVFVADKGVPFSHILMAVNEGAEAVLESPLETETVLTYVERAISGPSRFRYERHAEEALLSEIAQLEKLSKTLATQLAASRRLVEYLLATPVSAQFRRALVVSDSASQRLHLSSLLSGHGFRVSMAADADEGMAAALRDQPRIIISDLELRGRNGMELCREIKTHKDSPPCFFVICTADAEKHDEITAPGTGVDGCVSKPVGESGDRDVLAMAGMGLLL